MRFAFIIAACLALGGCGATTAASRSGVCAAFPAARHVVTATEREGQRWVDETVEAGVSACGFARPKARG